MPGRDRLSPTQPFPTKPAAFDRQGVTEDDLIDFTPSCTRRRWLSCRSTTTARCSRRESFEKPTIEMPGIAGGASWSGAACDPETGICYVSSVTLPYTATLVPSSVPHTGYIGHDERRWRR